MNCCFIFGFPQLHSGVGGATESLANIRFLVSTRSSSCGLFYGPCPQHRVVTRSADQSQATATVPVCNSGFGTKCQSTISTKHSTSPRIYATFRCSHYAHLLISTPLHRHPLLYRWVYMKKIYIIQILICYSSFTFLSNMYLFHSYTKPFSIPGRYILSALQGPLCHASVHLEFSSAIVHFFLAGFFATFQYLCALHSSSRWTRFVRRRFANLCEWIWCLAFIVALPVCWYTGQSDII